MPLRIVRNDITKMKVDAIVNTANPKPVCASGTDLAIYQAAGADQLLEERKKIGEIKVGEAVITPAFDLESDYIIHTVGPVWEDGMHGERDSISQCYQNSLSLAAKHHCESIAFPLISTGVYGFPKDEAFHLAILAISQFLLTNEMMVYLVVFDKESMELSEKVFLDVDSYIDDHYVEEQLKYEYNVSEDYLQSPNQLCRDRKSKPADLSEEKKTLTPKLSRVKKLKSAIERDSDSAIRRESEFSIERDTMPAPKRTKRTASISNRSLEDVMSQLGETFQECLLRLIDERNMTDIEVYKKANLSRKLFSKIRCNKAYKPTKKTAVALAISLQLSLDETKDLLQRAEMALSPSSKFDLIIEYFIEQRVYDIYTINLALFDHDQPILGE